MSLPSLVTQFHLPIRTPRIVVLRVRDRNGGAPFADVMLEAVEESEVEEGNGAVRRASLCLHYQRLVAIGDEYLKASNWFSAGYCGRRQKLSLTSTTADTGAIYLDPGLQGQRIGTYLMSRLVEWGRQWPQASVNCISLKKGEAYAENKQRRNAFYERYGITFDFDDPESQETGSSRPMDAGELVVVDSWRRNIEEIHLDQYVSRLLRDESLASAELAFRDAALKNLLAEERRRDRRSVFGRLGQLIRSAGRRLNR